MADMAPDAPLDEVEWRIDGKVDAGGGVRAVPYLEAPTVSRLLDEWVGPWRWRAAYEPTGKQGSLWCHLSVAHPDGEWITKTNLGVSSAFEPDKGIVSDAFKRVAQRDWGVGRNVLALPILRLPKGKFRAVDDRNGVTQGYMTDESLQWIAAELKRRGFDDAAKAAEAADPPVEQASDESESEPSLTTAQENVAKLAANMDDDGKKALREWWKTQQLPGYFTQLTDEQCQAVTDKINALADPPF